MATLSSHILDSVAGCSAIGIKVQLYKQLPDSHRELVFEVLSDDEGRISEQVDVLQKQQYELVFHSADYFQSTSTEADISQNISQVVVRFSIQNRQKRYHIPLVLSPHSYTLWWSN